MASAKNKKPSQRESFDFYDEAFFRDLYKMLNASNAQKELLNRGILLAAQNYRNIENRYNRRTTPSSIKKEIKMAENHLQQAEKIISRIYRDAHYTSVIVQELSNNLSDNNPALNPITEHLVKRDGFFTTYNSELSLQLINSMRSSLSSAYQKFKKPKSRVRKSDAVNYWLLGLAWPLEDILKRPLEQGRYHKGEYHSKGKEVTDSKLLQIIMKPLNPKVTLSQLETAIKETRDERLNPPEPWEP